MKLKILYPTKNSVVSSIDARRLYLIITLIHIYCKSFVNFIVSQVSLLAFMILFVVITRATPETSVRLWRVIQLVWIATLTLAMTEKIKIAHAVRHMAMTIFFAITKIFNSISFRDYSLLFIKKIY